LFNLPRSIRTWALARKLWNTLYVYTIWYEQTFLNLPEISYSSLSCFPHSFISPLSFLLTLISTTFFFSCHQKFLPDFTCHYLQKQKLRYLFMILRNICASTFMKFILQNNFCAILYSMLCRKILYLEWMHIFIYLSS